jgi:hypothetical protein
MASPNLDGEAYSQSKIQNPKSKMVSVVVMVQKAAILFDETGKT